MCRFEELLQVYVDDFCYAATQSEDGEHIPTIRRAAIHGIHAVTTTEVSPDLGELVENRWCKCENYPTTLLLRL